MYKSSYFFLIPLLSIFSLFWSQINTLDDQSSLLDLYSGVPYSGNWYVVLLHYFLFACYSFIVFNKSEKYTSGYGIYVVLRVQSKMKIIMQLVYQTFLFVIIGECIKVIVYVCTLLIISGALTLESENVSIFINMFFIHVNFLFIFLLIQITIELFTDSKVALIFVQMSYLILLSLGDFIYKIIGESYWNLLFLPNLLMYNRLQTFYTFDFLHISCIYMLALFLLILTIFITKKYVHKKNWI